MRMCVVSILVWMGWVMVAALIYSVIPPVVLGRMKRPLARELHDKALKTSAMLDKGDWLSGIAGVLGNGLWWADSAAAAFISIEIVKDGFGELSNSIAQLMNKRPSDVESKEPDPIVDELQDAFRRLDWVADVRVRLREDGDVVTGEAFVAPRDERDLLPNSRRPPGSPTLRVAPARREYRPGAASVGERNEPHKPAPAPPREVPTSNEWKHE
jgi:divalent metal cation (Fe/Co/Zn/Cd) transporter